MINFIFFILRRPLLLRLHSINFEFQFEIIFYSPSKAHPLKVFMIEEIHLLFIFPPC